VDEHTRRLIAPVNGGATKLVQVVRDLDELGIRIDDIALRRPTLDDVFLALTGHAAAPEVASADQEEKVPAGAGSSR
jgi:ABC-2 type transport system ATP-binding protein